MIFLHSWYVKVLLRDLSYGELYDIDTQHFF